MPFGAERADIEKPVCELETAGDGSDEGGGDVAVDAIVRPNQARVTTRHWLPWDVLDTAVDGHK